MSDAIMCNEKIESLNLIDGWHHIQAEQWVKTDGGKIVICEYITIYVNGFNKVHKAAEQGLI